MENFPDLALEFFGAEKTSVQLVGGFTKDGSNDSKIYHSLLKWIGVNIQDLRVQRSTTEVVKIQVKQEQDLEDTIMIQDNGNSSEQELKSVFEETHVYNHSKTIGYGTNFFLYKGSLIKVERSVLEPQVRSNGVIQEVINFTTAVKNGFLITEILEASKPKIFIHKDDNTMRIYQFCIESESWYGLGRYRKKRPLNTIILDSQAVGKLQEDIRNFLNLEDWYLGRGIPYRRAYLLHGPPGCGKSSVIKSIAGEIGYNIAILSLSQGITDESLNAIINEAPEKSVILLEDIDAAFKSRENPNATSRETNMAFEGRSNSALTFGGLLNALDGVGSAEEGLIIFMTTNYPERLDPALVRPGRVDFRMKIDYPNDEQLGRMFERFYPDAGNEVKTKFVESLRALNEVKISMAMVQGLFLLYKDDPEEAIRNVKEILG